MALDPCAEALGIGKLHGGSQVEQNLWVEPMNTVHRGDTNFRL